MAKNFMKNSVILLIMIVLSVSCGSPATPITENEVATQTDDYALLKEPDNIPSKTTEDLSGRVILLYENDFIERITALNNPKGFQYLGQTPCIVDLYADWCRPCIALNQLLNELAPEYQGKVIFYKLNADKAPDVTRAFNVTTIPKILYFKPYGEISSTVGFLNKEELKKAIHNYLLKP